MAPLLGLLGMGGGNSQVKGAAAEAAVSKALRFNGGDTPHLTRTPGSAGNRRTWTWSAWIKRSGLGQGGSNTEEVMWASNGTTDSTNAQIQFGEDDDLQLLMGYPSHDLKTSARYVDVGAWYHFVVAVDVTQGTASNKVKMYVNGDQITAFATDQRSDYTDQDWAINSTQEHKIGNKGNDTRPFDGYMTNIHLIDGLQLTPTSFAETDGTTSQWIPKTYSGAYGTNGFFLQFADNSAASAAALGKDGSGSGNNYTPTNLSVSAGTGNDSLFDSPINGDTADDTGAGGEVTGNYCTMTPLLKHADTDLEQGNLYVKREGAWKHALGTWALAANTGKWYFEAESIDPSGTPHGVLGIATKDASLTETYGGAVPQIHAAYVNATSTGGMNISGSWTGSVNFTAGNYIGVAVDTDAQTVRFYRNGVADSAATDWDQDGPYFPWVGSHSTGWILNFGQRAFTHAAPSGYKTLCSANITAAVESPGTTAFNIEAWSGNSSSPRDLATDFSPDIFWVKQISGGSWNWLTERVDSANKWTCNKDYGSSSNSGSGWATVDTDKAVLTTGSSDADNVNESGSDYQAWYWKADNTTGSSDGEGSLSSTVSVSTTNGTSIVKYTGGGGAATVGHGLDGKPDMIWTHNKSSAMSTLCYHSAIGASNILQVNQNQAKFANSGAWNDTEPTSTVFSIGSYGDVSGSGNTIVAYVFRSIEGFSKFSSYAGTGAEGNFVYLGFRPKFIIIKGHDFSGEPWVLWDDTRDPYNECDDRLIIAQNESPASNEDQDLGDILSNGFRLMNSWDGINGSSKNYIYAAWAESPLKTARAR